MPPPPLDRCSTPPTLPGRLQHGILSPPASDADDSLAGFRAADCPMRPRIDDVFSCHRDDDGDWFEAWRDQQSPPAIRKETLEAHLYPVQKPTPAHSLLAQRPFTPSALRPDHNNRVALTGSKSSRARGSDPRILASHLKGPWHVVCVQEGRGFVTDRSLAENFHVITKHHCAVLLNKDPFDSGYMCTAIQVPCTHRYSSWALEGMVVTGKFRRPPDPAFQCFTVANVQINSECAKRRSVYIALLLLAAICASSWVLWC